MPGKEASRAEFSGEKDSAAFLFAGAAAFEFLAGGRDLQALGFHGEPELMRDFVLDLRDLVALELDDLLAVLADDMAVVRVLGVVGIVKLVVLAEIHFADESAL